MATERDDLTPGLDALAELTGADRDQLLAHPRLLLSALGAAGRDLLDTALGLVDQDPTTKAAAAVRRSEIEAVLSRGRGTPAGPDG